MQYWQKKKNNKKEFEVVLLVKFKHPVFLFKLPDLIGLI